MILLNPDGKEIPPSTWLHFLYPDQRLLETNTRLNHNFFTSTGWQNGLASTTTIGTICLYLHLFTLITDLHPT